MLGAPGILTVGFSSVLDAIDGDPTFCVVNVVQHPVDTNSQAVAVHALQLLGIRRAGVLTQTVNVLSDKASIVLGKARTDP